MAGYGPRHLGLWLVLALFLGLASVYNVLVPPWEAPEEPLHFDYVRHLIREKSLPAPVRVAGAWRPGGESESHQVPLYYLLTAALTAWVEAGEPPYWHRNPYATWVGHPAAGEIALHREDEGFPWPGPLLALHATRFVSTLMGLVTVACTYVIGLRLTQARSMATLAAACNAFLPGFLFSSATVNNDAAVIMFSSLALLVSLGILRPGGATWLQTTVFGTLMGAAILSKGNGLFLVPYAVVLFWICWRRGQPWSDALAGGLAAGALVLVMVLPWYLRLTLFYGIPFLSVMGDPQHPAPPFSSVSWETVPWLVNRLFTSFWGVFGWQNVPLPGWLYGAFAAVGLLVVVGLFRFARKGAKDQAPKDNGGYLLMGWAIGLMVTLVVVRYLATPSPGLDHARYLYPAISALSLLLVLGLAWLAPNPWGWRMASTCVGGLAVAALAAPFGVIRPTYTPPYPVRLTVDANAIARPANIAFDAGVTFLGYTTQHPSWRLGTTTLDLYWRADREGIEDFVAFVQLVDLQGRAQLTHDVVPLKETFPPGQWHRGEVVREQRELALSPDTPAGLYRLELGLYRWPGVVAILGREGDASAKKERFVVGAIKVPQPAVDVSQVQHLTALDYGEMLSLRGYRLSAETVTAGEALLVTLFWQAKRTVSRDYVISLQLIGPDGRLVAQHDGEPAQGRYPTSVWEEGETVVEERTLMVPEQTPEGEHQLVVAVYHREEQKRLLVRSQGGTLTADMGLLRRIRVERRPK